MITNKEKASKRIAICESCAHFRKRSRTCGTPIVGNKVGSKRTCGCFMDVKTKINFASCPLSKWEQYEVSKKDIKDIKHLLESVKYEISGQQKTVLFDMVRKYIGGNKKTSNCMPCLKSAIQDMKRIVKEYDSESIENQL
tara:strand:+ start:785 stop:1204 length:420 start_codon:yes stop_codon:yes gene_type:complete